MKRIYLSEEAKLQFEGKSQTNRWDPVVYVRKKTSRYCYAVDLTSEELNAIDDACLYPRKVDIESILQRMIAV